MTAGLVTEHRFDGPLHRREVVLVIGPDHASSGVRHAGIPFARDGRDAVGCDELAEVAPELDYAFCTRCRWGERISGAWYVDLVNSQGTPAPAGDFPESSIQEYTAEGAVVVEGAWWCEHTDLDGEPAEPVRMLDVGGRATCPECGTVWWCYHGLEGRRVARPVVWRAR